MREIKNKLTTGKNTRNTQTRKTKSFGYQVLGFGAGESGPAFICATGGTITTCGNFKIHTFNANGCFVVNQVGKGTPAAPNTVDYLVVAGGGGGSSTLGGGGGGGGFRTSSGAASGCYSTSPLGACVAGLTLCAQTYPISVGGGGPGQLPGRRGSNSVFSTITSTGGGGGGNGNQNAPEGNQTPGGSGGGGQVEGFTAAAGTGNTPPVSPPQGQNGGNGAHRGGGGGGGAGGSGVAASGNSGGNGGVGTPTNITGSATNFSGGGGGGAYLAPSGSGSGSPCGTGGQGGPTPGKPSGGETAADNTGGGGGSSQFQVNSGGGGLGGSGKVVIRYKFQ